LEGVISVCRFVAPSWREEFQRVDLLLRIGGNNLYYALGGVFTTKPCFSNSATDNLQDYEHKIKFFSIEGWFVVDAQLVGEKLQRWLNLYCKGVLSNFKKLTKLKNQSPIIQKRTIGL